MPPSHRQSNSSAENVGSNACLPVVLLVRGRRCLVVGGGRIATRKVSQLLAAGADVTVVSPVAAAPILAWAHDGRITYRPRSFAAADVRGCFAAFAATDDAAVNRRLLAAGRRHGVLATAADANWPNGDFITPAVVADAELTIAISTGGRSCRRAKQVRRLLQDRLDLIGACDLLVVSARWRANAKPADAIEIDRTAARLRQVLSVHEFVVAATPTGIELLAVVRAGPDTAALIPRLLPAGLRAPHLFRGVAAMRQAINLWAADGNGDLARAATRAQRQGWADERMLAWIKSTRRRARRLRVKRSLNGADEDFTKDYERLIGTVENRNAGK